MQKIFGKELEKKYPQISKILHHKRNYKMADHFTTETYSKEKNKLAQKYTTWKRMTCPLSNFTTWKM